MADLPKLNPNLTPDQFDGYVQGLKDQLFRNPLLDKKLSEVTVDELLDFIGYKGDHGRRLEEARKEYSEAVDEALAQFALGEQAFQFSSPELFTNMQDFHKWHQNVMRMYNENPHMKLVIVAAGVF